MGPGDSRCVQLDLHVTVYVRAGLHEDYSPCPPPPFPSLRPSVRPSDTTTTRPSLPPAYPSVRLSFRLSFRLLLCTPVRMPGCKSVRPSVRPSVCRSVRPSVRLPACPSARPSVRLPTRPSVRPSVCPSARLPVRPSVCLPAHPSVRPAEDTQFSRVRSGRPDPGRVFKSIRQLMTPGPRGPGRNVFVQDRPAGAARTKPRLSAGSGFSAVRLFLARCALERWESERWESRSGNWERRGV